MSIFHLPRVNFWGTQTANPGTANNDSASPGEELSVTSDTERVRAMTRNMDDDEFRKWITSLDQSGLLVSQWNYYGDMSVRFVDVRVRSVLVDYGDPITNPDRDSLIGAPVSLNNCVMCDTNPEGFNSTQMFSESLAIGTTDALGGSGVFLSRKPSRAVTRWLNWYRNVSYHGRFGLPPTGRNGQLSSGGAGGASALFQSVVEVKKRDLEPVRHASTEDEDQVLHKLLAGEGSPAIDALLEALRLPEVKGLVFRYDLYSCFPHYSDTTLSKLYTEGKKVQNPSYGLVIGTIAPWYEGEAESIAMGRYLKPCRPYPNPYRPTKPYFLSPCIASVDADHERISIDTANCLPEDGPDQFKYDLGTVSLGLRQATAVGEDPAENSHPVVPVGDLDNHRDAWIDRGGIYDVSYADLSPGEKAWIADDGYELVLSSSLHGVLLYEPEYMLESDSECNYLDELPPGKSWSDPAVRARLARQPFVPLRGEIPVFLRRRGCVPDGSTGVKVEQWKYTPTGYQGEYGTYRYPILLEKRHLEVEGGEATFSLDPADGPGVRFFRFVPGGIWPQETSPERFANLVFREYYAIVRVLPYDDYSAVKDEELTFDLIYEEIFRYYDLILPAMSQRLDMSDPTIWGTPTAAFYVLRMIDKELWGTYEYMPRTRDLSRYRRKLLRRFCEKILVEHGQKGRVEATAALRAARGGE